MKRLLLTGCIGLLLSCNVSVEEENDRDTTSRQGSTLEKVDDKLEEWGDTAKARFKDAKNEVKERFDKDSTADRN